jgi:heme exporter protein D
MAAAALSHWANALALGEAGAWIKLAAAVSGVAVLARKLRRLSQHKHTVELT